MIPLLKAEVAVSNRIDKWDIFGKESKALRDKDEESLANLKEKRKNMAIHHDQFGKIFTVVQRVFDSKWFLFVILWAMLISILFTLRKVPGQHLFTGQIVGFFGLLLPFIWWSLWLGYWIPLLLLALLLLPFLVWILNMINWVLTLLIQVSTLSLFVASSYHWTGPVCKKRMLLEVLWDNTGSKIGKKIAIYVGGWLLFCISFSIFIVLIFVDLKVFWNNFAATFCWLPFSPLPINIVLSVIIYAEIIGCLVSLMFGLKQKYNQWRRGLKMLGIWTIVCLIMVAITFLCWGLSYIFSNYSSRALGIIFLLALVVMLVIVLRKIMREVIPLMESVFQFIGIRRSIGSSFSIEQWKEELRRLDPNFQASLLSRTAPENLGLKMDSFLSLLQEVQPIIEEEPALTVYWSMRNKVEQILHLQKSG